MSLGRRERAEDDVDGGTSSDRAASTGGGDCLDVGVSQNMYM